MANEEKEQLFVSSIFAEEFIDVEMTETVSSHISKRSQNLLNVGNGNTSQMQSFELFYSKFNDLRNCKEVQSACNLYGLNYGLEVLKNFHLDAGNKTVCLEVKYYSWSRKKILFVITPNTVLVFLCSDKYKEFLCALLPSAIKLEYVGVQRQTKKVIVEEKSREPIEYYDKFNPYSDSKIISRNWEKTNLDGSRSFAGGLKPENNRLCLELEYGQITFTICGLHFDILASNAVIAKDFVSVWENSETQTNAQFFDTNKQLSIRKKCINSYFSGQKSHKSFLATIKEKPILIVPIALAGFVVIGVVLFGIVKILLA